MKTLGKALLAATAAIGVVGAGSLALAQQNPTFHTMTVQLPDGALAKIRYTGNVAPKVTIESPMDAAFFAPVAPFGMLNAISARVDREMSRLFDQAAPMNANQVFRADLRNMPKGMTEYSMVSTMTPNGACMHRTTIVSTGKGKPKVVSQTSGDCGQASASSTAGKQIPSFDSAANNWPKLHSIAYTR